MCVARTAHTVEDMLIPFKIRIANYHDAQLSQMDAALQATTRPGFALEQSRGSLRSPMRVELLTLQQLVEQQRPRARHASR